MVSTESPSRGKVVPKALIYMKLAENRWGQEGVLFSSNERWKNKLLCSFRYQVSSSITWFWLMNLDLLVCREFNSASQRPVTTRLWAPLRWWDELQSSYQQTNTDPDHLRSERNPVYDWTWRIRYPLIWKGSFFVFHPKQCRAIVLLQGLPLDFWSRSEQEAPPLYNSITTWLIHDWSGLPLEIPLIKWRMIFQPPWGIALYHS